MEKTTGKYTYISSQMDNSQTITITQQAMLIKVGVAAVK